MIIRKSEGRYFAERAIDQVLVYLSWLAAYFIRFEIDVMDGQQGLLSWYLQYGVLLIIISTYFFKNSKLYKNKGVASLAQDILNQVKSNTISVLCFVVFAFFLSQDRVSRFAILTYFIISTVVLTLNKILLRRYFMGKKTRVLLVGNGRAMKNYYLKIKKVNNINIIGSIDPIESFEGSCFKELTREGLEENKVDLVVIGYSGKDNTKLDSALRILKDELTPLVVLPEIQEAVLGFNIQDFQGTPMIVYNEPKFNTLNLFIKRISDFMLCSIGMLFISPLLILIALIVKFTSKGPIFYGQVRMGVDGKEFKMWKFRSMRTDSSNKETWTVKNDPRVTAIGNFIRKTSLDELPQLWNVIVGDMSLVGPRPERPMYVDQFRGEIPAYMLRHKMKAGITGWAQVNGWRGDTSIEKRIECDLWYIKNWSLPLDITIIFLTFWKGFINKNAY